MIAEVNKLSPFPIGPQDLIGWAQDVERLVGGVDIPIRLQIVFDAFKTGDLEWDKSMGIQNIFRGLKRVWKNEKGQYELLQPL